MIHYNCPFTYLDIFLCIILPIQYTSWLMLVNVGWNRKSVSVRRLRNVGALRARLLCTAPGCSQFASRSEHPCFLIWRWLITTKSIYSPLDPYWLYMYILDASCMFNNIMITTVLWSDSLISQAAMWISRLVVEVPIMNYSYRFFYPSHQCSGIVIRKTLNFEEKEMARIYSPSQKFQNAKFSTFWRFPPNAQNSWREPWLARLVGDTIITSIN